MGNRRMLAEWENPSRILLSLPTEFTDWDYILPDAIKQYESLLSALAEGEEHIIMLSHTPLPPALEKIMALPFNRVIKEIPYNDTWTRDYGPITVDTPHGLRELDFGFNGWGLKFAADEDNLVNWRMSSPGYENHRDFILEGGSIETDGMGTILTTSRCLCSLNRNGGKSKPEIEAILAERLGADRVLWLDYGFLAGDDTDSHIDTLARMAPGDTIVYVAPPKDSSDMHFAELSKMEEQLKGFVTSNGEPYRLIPLPFPEPIYDDDGERLPATYANYLVTRHNLFIPVYGEPAKDKEAVKAITKAFPKHKGVFTVDCRTLIRQHGSLHCSTMQLYH